jgi:hypothetical protein
MHTVEAPAKEIESHNTIVELRGNVRDSAQEPGCALEATREASNYCTEACVFQSPNGAEQRSQLDAAKTAFGVCRSCECTRMRENTWHVHKRILASVRVLSLPCLLAVAQPSFVSLCL